MPKSSFNVITPDDSIGFLLWQTTVVWQRNIKLALDQFEISHAQFVVLANILWFVEQRQSPNQIMIVNLSKLDKMTVSKALKKLVTLQLVTRVEDPTDTRAKALGLTVDGTKLTKKLISAVEQVDGRFFSVLKKSEKKMLLALFMKLAR